MVSSRQGEGVEANKYLFVRYKLPGKKSGMEVGCEGKEYSHGGEHIPRNKWCNGTGKAHCSVPNAGRWQVATATGRRLAQNRHEDEGKGEKERHTWLMTVRRIRGKVATGCCGFPVRCCRCARI